MHKDRARHTDKGVEYTHLSRVERKEVESGRPIYIPHTDILMPGLPMTVQFGGSGRIPLAGSAADKLWFEEFKKAADPTWAEWMVLRSYVGLKKDGRFATDFTAGLGYNPVMTTANPIYLLGETKDIGGEPHLKFRTIKYGKLAEMRHQLSRYPLCKYNCTISRREDGGRRVIPFQQLSGRSVPGIVFGKYDFAWMPARRVRVMSRTEPIPNSYYPG
jgi:hypothetical protein